MDELVLKECKELLRRHGMTQAKAAERLDITDQHLSAVFAGRKRPSEDLRNRIAALRDKLKSSGLLETA